VQLIHLKAGSHRKGRTGLRKTVKKTDISRGKGMNYNKRIIQDGVIAGALGAMTVAIWFLIFDISRSAPLETPALLAAALLHGGNTDSTIASLAIQYTVVHFFAFAIFGMIGAVLLEAAERNRSLLVVSLLLLAAFEYAFVGITIFLGPELQRALSWWSVLVSNLLATAVMVGYFFGRHPRLVDQLFGRWAEVFAEGSAAGVVGGTAIVIWFLLHDIGRGSNPFRTPAVLGGVLLQGVHDSSRLAASGPVVMAYTVLHFAVFIAFGVIAATLAALLDGPELMTVFILVFCVFNVFFVGFAPLLSDALSQQIGWGPIEGANLIAAIAMLAFFYWRRSVLHAESEDPKEIYASARPPSGKFRHAKSSR